MFLIKANVVSFVYPRHFVFRLCIFLFRDNSQPVYTVSKFVEIWYTSSAHERKFADWLKSVGPFWVLLFTEETNNQIE